MGHQLDGVGEAAVEAKGEALNHSHRRSVRRRGSGALAASTALPTYELVAASPPADGGPAVPDHYDRDGSSSSSIAFSSSITLTPVARALDERKDVERMVARRQMAVGHSFQRLQLEDLIGASPPREVARRRRLQPAGPRNTAWRVRESARRPAPLPALLRAERTPLATRAPPRGRRLHRVPNKRRRQGRPRRRGGRAEGRARDEWRVERSLARERRPAAAVGALRPRTGVGEDRRRARTGADAAIAARRATSPSWEARHAVVGLWARGADGHRPPPEAAARDDARRRRTASRADGSAHGASAPRVVATNFHQRIVDRSSAASVGRRRRGRCRVAARDADEVTVLEADALRRRAEAGLRPWNVHGYGDARGRWAGPSKEDAPSTSHLHPRRRLARSRSSGRRLRRGSRDGRRDGDGRAASGSPRTGALGSSSGPPPSRMREGPSTSEGLAASARVGQARTSATRRARRLAHAALEVTGGRSSTRCSSAPVIFGRRAAAQPTGRKPPERRAAQVDGDGIVSSAARCAAPAASPAPDVRAPMPHLAGCLEDVHRDGVSARCAGSHERREWSGAAAMAGDRRARAPRAPPPSPAELAEPPSTSSAGYPGYDRDHPRGARCAEAVADASEPASPRAAAAAGASPARRWRRRSRPPAPPRALARRRRLLGQAAGVETLMAMPRTRRRRSVVGAAAGALRRGARRTVDPRRGRCVKFRGPLRARTRRAAAAVAAGDGADGVGSREKARRAQRPLARRRVRAHHPGAHTGSTRWRCCRAERASSAARRDGTAKLWTLDGALERTFEVGEHGARGCVAALPDGVHFVVGLRRRVTS